MDVVESYIDDILVYSSSWTDHLSRLQELFNRLRQAGLTARPTKCMIGTASVEFIGHIIGRGKIMPLHDNVAKIRNAPRPVTKKEVRSFLGLTGYYREYIPHYSAIAVPLSDLTKKKQPNKIQWGDAQEKAYNALKSMITNSPVL